LLSLHWRGRPNRGIQTMSPDHESMAANNTMNSNPGPKANLAAPRCSGQTNFRAPIFAHETGVPKIAPSVARTTSLSAITYPEMRQESKNCGGSNLSHAEAFAAPNGIEKSCGRVDFSSCYTGTPGVTSTNHRKSCFCNQFERIRGERQNF